MKKRDLLESIHAYLDGTLPEEEKRKLEQLVAEDPEVAALYEDCLLAYKAIQIGREEKLREDMKDWDKEKKEQ